MTEAMRPRSAQDEFADWLTVCGSCDAGLPLACICPLGDPRSVILALVERIDRVLALCGNADTGWPSMVARILRGESPPPSTGALDGPAWASS